MMAFGRSQARSAARGWLRLSLTSMGAVSMFAGGHLVALGGWIAASVLRLTL